jgi:hypothetical protein
MILEPHKHCQKSGTNLATNRCASDAAPNTTLQPLMKMRFGSWEYMQWNISDNWCSTLSSTTAYGKKMLFKC